MGMVVCRELLIRYSGTWKLFHTPMAAMIRLVTVTGFIMGSRMRKISRSGPAPSMMAASSISRGTPVTKLEKVITAKGRLMAVNTRITPR